MSAGLASDVPVHRQAWTLWCQFCEQSVVLPWIRTVQKLALGAEDDHEFRRALATEARVRDLQQRLATQLWELEPTWCAELPALAPWRPRDEAMPV